MNHQGHTSLGRVIARLERRRRRARRRPTTAPLVLAAGLVLSDLLLVRLVPGVWPALLATDPGESLRGWPLAVWQTSGLAGRFQPLILAALAVLTIVTFVLASRSRALRYLTWAAAAAVVVADAGIVWATLQACLMTSGMSV